jgi:hypothetical protein
MSLCLGTMMMSSQHSLIMSHAGVIAMQGPQGFWLTHSNPNFPDDPKISNYTGEDVT